MVAFLIAGVILGVLAWVLRRGPGDPSLVLTVIAGVVGALVGGVGINLVLSEPYADLNVWSFGMACLLALVLLGLLEGGVGRRRTSS